MGRSGDFSVPELSGGLTKDGRTYLRIRCRQSVLAQAHGHLTGSCSRRKEMLDAEEKASMT